MPESRPYIILREHRIVRMYHGDLDKSYWNRGMTRGENDMQDIERVLEAATGLARIYRRHGYSHVDFVIRSKVLFDVAAVALQMQYTPDKTYASILKNKR